MTALAFRSGKQGQNLSYIAVWPPWRSKICTDTHVEPKEKRFKRETIEFD